MNSDYLIAFSNTHSTMKAKKVLAAKNIDFELIATPREISKECGFCLLLCNQTKNNMECIVQTLKSADLAKIELFKRGEKMYEKIY
jgi:hypothetical protein